MKIRVAAAFILVPLMLQAAVGCALFDQTNEELPSGRVVKTVDFPIRHLKFSDISCRQEYEDVELSGTLRNASPYELSNVAVEVKMLFAGEVPFEIFIIPTDPPTLLPGGTGEFSLETEVEDPVALVELHVLFEQVE